jgi:hypothetical protein
MAATIFRPSWSHLHAVNLTLSLLMSYIYGAPCKARNFNIVYTWTYVWQRWKPPLSICCTMFQHWTNAESYPVSQLCVNSLLTTKVTLITDGNSFSGLRVKALYCTLCNALKLRSVLHFVIDKIKHNMIWYNIIYNIIYYIII